MRLAGLDRGVGVNDFFFFFFLLQRRHFLVFFSLFFFLLLQRQEVFFCKRSVWKGFGLPFFFICVAT